MTSVKRQGPNSVEILIVHKGYIGIFTNVSTGHFVTLFLRLTITIAIFEIFSK